MDSVSIQQFPQNLFYAKGGSRNPIPLTRHLRDSYFILHLYVEIFLDLEDYVLTGQFDTYTVPNKAF
jgi:hypothetical protein